MHDSRPMSDSKGAPSKYSLASGTQTRLRVSWSTLTKRLSCGSCLRCWWANRAHSLLSVRKASKLWVSSFLMMQATMSVFSRARAMCFVRGGAAFFLVLASVFLLEGRCSVVGLAVLFFFRARSVVDVALLHGDDVDGPRALLVGQRG